MLFSNTKNCETVIEQTLGNAEETVKFKLTKPRETFQFNPPISIEGSWMNGLTSSEVYILFLIYQNKIKGLNFINFLIGKMETFHEKKSETKLKKTWKLQILQLTIYKMK